MTRTYFLLGALSASGVVALGCGAIEEENTSGKKSPLSIGDLCYQADSTMAECDSIARGHHYFNDGKLHDFGGGNGRSCNDCHMESDNFQLSPADVEARWQALQAKGPGGDDALFRDVDFDEFDGVPYANLRQNGLVRVHFKLPDNIRIVDPNTLAVVADSADVWRSVPTVLDVKNSGPDNGILWPHAPNPEGGYQLDARFGNLQEQAIGALNAHMQVASAPSSGDPFLVDLANFENALVSPAPRTDLTADEAAGKTIFERSCSVCHSGSAFSTPQGQPGIPRYISIFAGCFRPIDGPFYGLPAGAPARWQFKQCPPRLARNMRLYRIQYQNPDGTTAYNYRPSSDPGRALTTGIVTGSSPNDVFDDWEKLDNSPLLGISKRAPYFHNNSADTLEDVVDHYQSLFMFVNAVSHGFSPLVHTPDGQSRLLSDADKPLLVAYLKTL